MILNLYDLEHNKTAGLSGYKDASVESVLSMGDKTLSFLWHDSCTQKISLESYIRTETDEYVVKESSKSSNGYHRIVAKLNLEEIKGMMWQVYLGEELTAKEAADYALSDTGWTCISYVDETKKRNISLKKVSSYAVFEKIAEAFICEISWDSIRKVVYLYEKRGEDKGVYFIKGLNLIEVSDSSDTYDFATRIIPIGAGDLYITEVNNGKKYLDNFQYTTKVQTVIWEDGNYTDAQALMEDAEYKLNEISKPKRTYQAKVCDLAKMKPEYSLLEYQVGDIITLMDNEAGICEQQRITKTVEYLENPQKNTCDISNTVLSFADMQKQLFAAAECIKNITTDNGTVKGSSVDSIDVTQIIGLERYISENMDELRVNYLYVTSEMGTPSAIIGKLTATETELTKADIKNADIALENVTESHIQNLYADYLKVPVLEADNLSVVFEKVGNLEADYAKIDFVNVNTASIARGFLHQLMVDQGIIADRVVSGEVVSTGALTGVSIYADDITAGTLSVDRLVLRGSDKSLVYALNNSGGLESAQVDTLDAYLLTERTITADKIVAGSITANEINVGNLVATGFIGTNRLMAANINVNDLFAQNITAAGTIQSSNYSSSSTVYSANGIVLDMSTGRIRSKKFAIDASGNAYFKGNLSAPSGTIGGFTIAALYLANGTTSLAGASNSVYVGTAGISCGTNFKVTKTGILTAKSGTIGGWNINSDSLSYGSEGESGYMSLNPFSGKISTMGNFGKSTLTEGALKFARSIDGKEVSYASFNTGGWESKDGIYGARINSETASKFISFGNKKNESESVYTTVFLLNYGLNPYKNGDPSQGELTQDVLIFGNTYAGGNIYFSNNQYIGAYATGIYCTGSLLIGPENTSVEGGQLALCAAPSYGYTAYLDVCQSMFRIHYNGTVGFSLNMQNHQIYMSGDVYCNTSLYIPNHSFNSMGVYNTVSSSAANIHISSGGWFYRSTSSSKRYKRDIRRMDIADLKGLYHLPISIYKYNAGYLCADDERCGKDIPGIIVEDLEEVLPIAVNHENGRPEMWNNNILVPCILGLVQDLNVRINRLEDLQQMVYVLQLQLEEAKNKIAQLENAAA